MPSSDGAFVVNPDSKAPPTMGSQVSVHMKPSRLPKPDISDTPSNVFGGATESSWIFCRSMQYSFRVVIAAAVSTLLVLRRDTIDALHPATDTASFLMPVFAIIAAEPTLGETIRNSVGCALASTLYAVIAWTEIQLMNQLGIGLSPWAYIFCMFFTCFGCLLSPFNMYVKRIFMGMYVLIMVKNLEMKDAGTQYWRYPWYFGLSVCCGCFMALIVMAVPSPRLFDFPRGCKRWIPRLALYEARHHASRSLLASSRIIKALLTEHALCHVQANLTILQTANLDLAAASTSAWWECAWLGCTRRQIQRLDSIRKLNAELICAFTTAKDAASETPHHLQVAVSGLAPQLVTVFTELSEEDFLGQANDTPTAGITMLEEDDVLAQPNDETVPAHSALLASVADVYRIVNQFPALLSVDKSGPLTATLSAPANFTQAQIFPAGVCPRVTMQAVVFSAKISFTAVLAASIGDHIFAYKMFGWEHTLANGFWAPLTVAFIFNETSGAGLLRTLQRWTGTVIACIYTLMVYYWWIDTLDDIDDHQVPIIFMMMPATFLASMFRCMNPEVGYAGAVCAFTTAIAMIGANKVATGESTFSKSDVYIVSRMQQTFIGVTCLIVVQSFIFPVYAWDAAKAAPQAAIQALRGLVGVLTMIADSKVAPDQERVAAYAIASKAITNIMTTAKEAVAEPALLRMPLDEKQYSAFSSACESVCQRANALLKLLIHNKRIPKALELQFVQIDSVLGDISDGLVLVMSSVDVPPASDTNMKFVKAHAAAAQVLENLESQASGNNQSNPAAVYICLSLARAVLQLSHISQNMYADYCSHNFQFYAF